MSGLTSPGGFRGDAEGVTEADAGGGGENRVGGRRSGRAPGIATSSSTMISGRASNSSADIGGGAGTGVAEGGAARVEEVGLDDAAAGGVAVAIALGSSGGTGDATQGDDDDTLVLLDEMDDDRDLARAAALAPARLFDRFAAEGGLVLGERGVRGVLREFLRTLGERSRPITGRAGVAPPPSVVVDISGRGRSWAVEDGVFARFLGNGRGGFSFI